MMQMRTLRDGDAGLAASRMPDSYSGIANLTILPGEDNTLNLADTVRTYAPTVRPSRLRIYTPPERCARWKSPAAYTVGLSCMIVRPQLIPAQTGRRMPGPQGPGSTPQGHFRGNISPLITSMYLLVAWYTPGKVLMGRPWEAQGI